MDFDRTFIPLPLVKKGGQFRGAGGTVNLDPVLNRAMAKAHYWQSLIDSGQASSGSEIAKAEGIDPSVVNEILRLTLLAPDIAQSIIDGNQPANLSLIWFQRNPLPLDWQKQRELMDSFKNSLYQ
jgi:hypothetical protein